MPLRSAYRQLVQRWGSTRDPLRLAVVPGVAWLIPGRWALVGAGRAVVVARARNDRRFQVYHANYDQSAVWSAARLEPDPVTPWTEPLRELLFGWLARGAELTGLDLCVRCSGPNELLAATAWACGCAMCAWRPLWERGEPGSKAPTEPRPPRPPLPGGSHARAYRLHPERHFLPDRDEPWALAFGALRAAAEAVSLEGRDPEGRQGMVRLALVEMSLNEDTLSARAWPVDGWCAVVAPPEEELARLHEAGIEAQAPAGDTASGAREESEALLRAAVAGGGPQVFRQALATLARAQGQPWPWLWQWTAPAPGGQFQGRLPDHGAADIRGWKPCGRVVPAGTGPSRGYEPVPMVEVEACGAAWQACRIVRGGGAAR